MPGTLSATPGSQAAVAKMAPDAAALTGTEPPQPRGTARDAECDPDCELGEGSPPAAGGAVGRPSLMDSAMRKASAPEEPAPGSLGGATTTAGPPRSLSGTTTTATSGAGDGQPGLLALPTGQEGAHVARSRSAGWSFRRKILTVVDDLERVTGEPGDIERDPSIAYGEAALTFKGVSFSVQQEGKEKVILAPVSGHFEPGTLVALMGPSGCGKTTLLDILAAKKTSPYSGTVHLNGRPRDRLFNRVTNYIAQDDIMPAHLTVMETVLFYAALKVERPRNLSNATLRFFIETRLKLMGLLEVKDTKIGSDTVRGISGGQRRRVSLACGLSSMAHVFFADEPTSGLSGTDAEACVRYMRLLAKKCGISFIVAIHQPRAEVSRLFDHLLLLTSHPGVAVYNGPMSEAPDACAQLGYPVPEFMNPTDHFLDLVTPGTRNGVPEVFVRNYREKVLGQVEELVDRELCHERKTSFELLQARCSVEKDVIDFPPARNTVFGVSFPTQLKFVFLRQLRLSLRDPLGVGLELMVSVGQSVVIGVAYLNVGEKDAYFQMLFFFMLLMTAALSGMKVMPKLIDERLIVKKETSEALYSDWAYIISFSVINGISAIIGNSIFVVLVWWMSGCDWGLFLPVFLWATLLYVVMDSLYTMIAAIAKDTYGALVLALPFLTLFLLYNGFTVYADILPGFMRFLLRLSPVAYTMEAVAISARQHVDPVNFGNIAKKMGYRNEPGTAITFMCGTVVLFRAIQVVCLKFLNNIKR